MNHDEVRFFCNGYYSEILVMNAVTLETLFTLNSKVDPDWISAIHVLRPAKSQGRCAFLTKNQMSMTNLYR